MRHDYSVMTNCFYLLQIPSHSREQDESWVTSSHIDLHKALFVCVHLIHTHTKFCKQIKIYASITYTSENRWVKTYVEKKPLLTSRCKNDFKLQLHRAYFTLQSNSQWSTLSNMRRARVRFINCFRSLEFNIAIKLNTILESFCYGRSYY